MKYSSILLFIMTLLGSCNQSQNTTSTEQGNGDKPFTFMVLDPGHFHAYLVMKKDYESVSDQVYVYAPEGQELDAWISNLQSYNTREENPTSWQVEVYKGPDYLQKMLEQKPGNIMVTAGNNREKTEYIRQTVGAGINVLADKPMAINTSDFQMLQEAFAVADQNDVLLYDIMTERYEITTMLQKAFSQVPAVFGELVEGSLEEPAVTKESVHHFFKYVSGKPLQRPAWFFDVEQQGEGIVDVTTHLVDLVMWECFPEQAIDYQTETELLTASRWPTILNQDQFQKVTGTTNYPDYLQKDLKNQEELHVFSNGEINFKIKGVHAKVSVIWNFQAPEGAGDTHFSIMRGSKANLIIRQGAEQQYKPELYIEPVQGTSLEDLRAGMDQAIGGLQNSFPGIGWEEAENGVHITIPDSFRVGHEAHFAQVTEKYLDFLQAGSLPEWEVPNMITKYYITTNALQMAEERNTNP